MKAGQVLAQIDQTRAQAAFLESQAKVASLTAALTRLEAEAAGVSPLFPVWLRDYPELIRNELDLMNNRRDAFDQQQQSLIEVRDLLQQELALNRPLLQTGDVSLSEILRLERQLAEVDSDLTNRRTQWFEDVQGRLTEVQSELSVAEQRLAQQQNLLDQTELRAPMRGVVKNVNITTVGGVIRPGDEVMQIVPLEDALLVEVRLSLVTSRFWTLGYRLG